MTEQCRFCGEFKSHSNFTSSLDTSIKSQLETYFKISIDSEEKMISSLICADCYLFFDKCCKFVQKIIDVQEQLKNDLLVKLNEEISCDEFETFELKIERLDEMPAVATTRISTVRRLVRKRNEVKIGKRNRGIKMTRGSAKYTMKDLFKDELKGKFASEVEQMAIPYADKEIDGKLSENLLSSLNNIGWFNYEWKCRGCEAIFTNVMDLEKHSIKCTKKRCHNSCAPCIKEFPSYSTFLNHITDKHQKILKFCCIICSEFRWSLTELYHHVCDAHEEHSIFICLYCGRHFFTGALLRDHLILHRPDEVLPEFLCDLCDYTTHRKQKVLSHMHRFHLERKFTCEVCAFTFKYRAELMQHQQSQHSDEANESCPVCGKNFKNRRKLRRHLKNMHEESTTVFSCEICGKKSKNKKSLTQHMKVHSDKDHYQCMYCDRSFKHTSGFTYHVRTHTGEKPYACPVEECDLKFIDWPNCRKHIRTFHGLDDLKPKQCKIQS